MLSAYPLCIVILTYLMNLISINPLYYSIKPYAPIFLHRAWRSTMLAAVLRISRDDQQVKRNLMSISYSAELAERP